ncbi:outer membrane protein assembly factor BamB family protein [Arcticibacter eurypsychrophilus]|uniref:outer membrane protein assembly factor BamB family protein n=1 Tax=Arcticibacter eurypsychrophilus TaxID=1434752 RepID=UPI000A73D2F9|nr:PQQ-binding-like beta-propeller repeat protein [Arcticibacter eurypsychrophilus]
MNSNQKKEGYDYGDWPYYGGNKAGNRYSPLTQINQQNVKLLHVAWQYNTVDDADSAEFGRGYSSIQCQPIMVHGVLYGTTAKLELFAVKAESGEQLWKFEPTQKEQMLFSNRGVAYWEDKSDKRILYTVGSTLYAIEALSGKPVLSFGKKGMVDLHEGLSVHNGQDVNSLTVVATSPGTVFKNTLIIGSRVSESGDAAPGYLRAFDIISGKLSWVFHTIPQPGEFGYETWPKDAYKRVGGANNWSGLVLDEKRGLVYFGTGSPASDFYGGDRKGTNLFANCIVALQAETGKLKWYYQTIHHDLWDRDLPCPPNLTTIKQNGKTRDVVVQATKDGLVYVLDRDKGTSIFPVEERAVPAHGLPGEHPWPTQKFPLKPLPFSSQALTSADLTDLSPAAHAFVKEQFDKSVSANKFTPPNTKGTILFGYSGGAEWGGNATDPNGILYLNANNDPWLLQMVDTVSQNKEVAALSHGNALYLINCAGCHGEDRRGNGTQFPNLRRIGERRSVKEIESILKTGQGRMPSFQHVLEKDRKEIVDFLLDTRSSWAAAPSEHEKASSGSGKKGVTKKVFGFKPAYQMKVWKKLTDQEGYPGIKPPWGTLNAIDMNTGVYLWRVPLGEYPELKKKGIPVTGTENYGGPVVTAGGLVFIAATRDEKIRAFDSKTGKVLWEFQLPAGGYATPITYMVKGKQYVVIAAGGGRGGKPGKNYIAFSL